MTVSDESNSPKNASVEQRLASLADFRELGRGEFLKAGVPLKGSLPDIDRKNALRMFALLAEYCLAKCESERSDWSAWGASSARRLQLELLQTVERDELKNHFTLVRNVYSVLAFLESDEIGAFQAYWRAVIARDIVNGRAAHHRLKTSHDKTP